MKLKLRDIRIIMMGVNLIAICFVSLFIYFTTRSICNNYAARDFLNTVNTLPIKPLGVVITCVFLYMCLVASFIMRERVYANNIRFALGSLVFDFFVSVAIVMTLNFNYNGIFFLVFASIISYSKGEKSKYFIICLALACFLLTDQELLSINYNLFSFFDYVNYYEASSQQYYIAVFNIIASLNIILFIVYCIFMIQQQKGTIEEINRLNDEIRKTNEDLQVANNQLEEYAKITEKMGQTKERNRLAREIHDTLGHTLTGISVGIDACIATIEAAPEDTKVHLEKISEVARNGLLDIRRSVNELKPDALEHLSLEVAITKMITDMNSITDMQIFFENKTKELNFDEDEESAIYRVIQESLTNAMRHGHASRVWIVIEKKDGEIELSIRDDGIGCNKIENGFGTKHIMERIQMLNGSVEYKSGDGFTVIARIPVRWGKEYD